MNAINYIFDMNLYKLIIAEAALFSSFLLVIRYSRLHGGVFDRRLTDRRFTDRRIYNSCFREGANVLNDRRNLERRSDTRRTIDKKISFEVEIKPHIHSIT